MEAEQIVDYLSRKVNHRIDIYAAPKKIDDYFKDLGFLSSEFDKSKQGGKEAGGSLFNIFTIKVSDGDSISEKIALDYRDKGKLIEKISQEEEGTQKNEDGNVKKKSLFHYTGPGHFTEFGERLDLYSHEQNELIQKDRERQEKISGKDTVLYTFEIGTTLYASIAAKDKFDLDALGSYGPEESHGILGLIERQLAPNIILINPFWIWYES